MAIALTGSSMQKNRLGKKYNLSVCAIFKNESNFLREWIEYHCLVGVDHFYLYSNNTTDRSVDILRPYIRKGLVTLVYWPDVLKDYEMKEYSFLWPLACQVPAYENAAKFRAIHETKWLACLDIDEFLVPSDATHLMEILQKYEEHPAVILSSEFFDSSKIETPRRELVIESLELTDSPQENPEKRIVKMIVKPEMTEGFTWPPYRCLFKEGEPACINKSELRINHYVNRGTIFREHKPIMQIDNRYLSESELRDFLSAGYEIEDQERTIYRFLPSLRKKMGIK